MYVLDVQCKAARETAVQCFWISQCGANKKKKKLWIISVEHWLKKGGGGSNKRKNINQN